MKKGFPSANTVNTANNLNTGKAGKNTPLPATSNKNKLSNELLEQQSNKIHAIKEDLEKAYERIREL